ncbi:hypothetical protein [Streptomyces sp. NPDC004065]|uniref:hypothetical protein n=1 Tax=Streptomyces sp. NPDC004065 TaxID=3364689 RepID=UPI00384A855D
MPEAVVDGGVPRAAALDGAAAPDGPGGPEGSAFERLGAVADAILYEGYLLYPYRRSSGKNKVRWQFGVLLPRDWAERDGPVPAGVSGSADSWYQQTECVLRVRRPGAVLRVRVRHLHMLHKQVEQAGPDGRYRPVESLRTGDGATHLSFDEAVPCETELVVPVDDLPLREHSVPVGAAAAETVEPLPGGAGRLVRRRAPLMARTTVSAERLARDLLRLRVRTENTARAAQVAAPREEALRQALIATHTLIGGTDVEFVSMTDPPAELAENVRECRNAFTFPVLGGDPAAGGSGTRAITGTGESAGTGEMMLSSPIILPDHPQVAPESPGDLHDAAEIDEILTLRTMLLTDEEKREARATDPRAAEILDRVDTMPDEILARLHGAIRSLSPAAPAAPAAAEHGRPAAPSGAGGPRPAWWQEGGDEGLSPTTDTVLVDGVEVGRGSRVRLRPRARGSDVQDMFLAGRTAEVAAVHHDVDGSAHLAVTLDDDPASELHTWYGRFHYFRPDELEPLEPLEQHDSRHQHSEGQQ